MENQTQRTFAYQLAETLQYDELDAISGGNGHMCYEPCGKITGDSSQGPIGHVDATFDF